MGQLPDWDDVIPDWADEQAMNICNMAMDNWAREPRSKIAKRIAVDLRKAKADGEPQWQPIETAPKDGTRILVWSSGTGVYPAIAAWCQGSYWGYERSHVNLGTIEKWMPLPKSPLAKPFKSR